jgi:hypothetical protein
MRSLQDPISKKTITKKRLVEWLKVNALSASPSTAKKKKRKEKKKSNKNSAVPSIWCRAEDLPSQCP